MTWIDPTELDQVFTYFVIPAVSKIMFEDISQLISNGTRKDNVNKIQYLGNVLNSKRNNKENIIGRISKATSSMTESLSLCSEVMIPSHCSFIKPLSGQLCCMMP